MSHTIKVKVQLRNKIALGISVVELHGTVLGEGTHNLYQGPEVGYGFTLPKWSFPLVVKENGELAYDDYHGIWGNPADIGILMQLYSIQAAKAAADAQGWMSERTGGNLLIFHPDGGTLTVSVGGVVDAQNFVGSGCATATQVIEAALGTRQEEMRKSEFFAERAHIAAHE